MHLATQLQPPTAQVFQPEEPPNVQIRRDLTNRGLIYGRLDGFDSAGAAKRF